MNFYRYESCDRPEHRPELNGFDIYIPNPIIRIVTFYLIKETKCGYWITDSQIPNELFDFKQCWKKWVSKTSIKRYAYLNKKDAYVSFEKRVLRRIQIIKGDLNFCNILLKLIINTNYEHH